ncbi:MAG: primosomal protein N' [Candidatus Omnitrophica bacterium]|nr:primosomal protein N' [Candidatus Omnitrophota bacterium]
MEKNIALVVVALPVDGPFDYSVQKDQMNQIEVGMRVKILFNRRKMMGFVVGFKEQSEFKTLNPILNILDNQPSISPLMLEWSKQVAEHYACSWGEILERLFPMALRKGHNIDYMDKEIVFSRPGSAPIKELWVDVSAKEFWPDMIESIKHCVTAGESTILLAPDKSHANQIVRKISKLIDVPIIHAEKKGKVAEQLSQYQKLVGKDPCVIIGTRSAVFSACPNVGQIIILDAENEIYKEEQSPHYQADFVAQVRAAVEGCRLILVTSNPSAEHWHMAKKEKWTVKQYPDKAQVQFQLVDMNNYNPQKTSILSFPLQNSLQKIFEQKGKALIYFNRKGFSTYTQCNQCGHALKCPRCNTNLNYVYSKKIMTCRSCNFHMELPSKCPQCKGAYLRSLGRGIEKLESEVHRYYPYVNVAVVDKDTKTIPSGTDIVLATSAIFNHTFKFSPDLVAVLQYDQEINRSDFRCSHKALSLLIKLRQLAKEKLIVQTRHPDDQSIMAAKTMDFSSFLDGELDNRKTLELPPYKQLIAVILRGTDEKKVLDATNLLALRFQEQAAEKVEVLDPYPDVRAKLRDQYRYIIMLKGKSNISLVHVVKDVLKNFKNKRNVIISVNVDP